MAESTLGLTLYDFLGDVGEYLGYGRGDLGGNTDPTWTDAQETAVERAVAAGQRQFYFPPPVEGIPPCEWSFLKPTGTVTLQEGESELALPDDFGGFCGPLVNATSGTLVSDPLTLMGEGIVRQMMANNSTATGRPMAVGLVPKKDRSVVEAQRFKLIFWPLADTDYTLTFPYILLPEAITGAKPYCYGGMQHVETVLASCLERAEFYRDNTRGVCYANWLERLAASVSIDRRMRPVSLGMNRDDEMDQSRSGFIDYWQSVTYT